MNKASTIFKELFLPVGYPNSVSKDYTEYQIWDSIQAIASSILMAISMTASLQVYGVGDVNASAYGSTMTWLFKDGVGMFGKIIFAWYLSRDVNLKRWRMLADICNDISFLVEILTPLFVQSRCVLLVLFVVGSILRAVVGVAGGTSRAIVAQHQSLHNNIGDVMAKDSSQEVLVNLISLFGNFAILSVVRLNYINVNMITMACLFIHLYSNHRLVRSLRLNKINVNRMALMIEKYIYALISGIESCLPNSYDLSIELINKEEPILRNVWWISIPLQIGTRNIESFSDEDQAKINTELKVNSTAGIYDGHVYYIVLTENYNNIDILRNCYHFCILNISLNWTAENENRYEMISIFKSNNVLEDYFSNFIEIVNHHGWNLLEVDMTIGPFRSNKTKIE